MNATDDEELWALDSVPRLRVALDATASTLAPADMLVLTRIDGRVTLDELCASAGLGEVDTMAILRRLVAQGLVVMDPPPIQPESAAAPTETQELCDLEESQRKPIDEFFARLAEMDLFELLGVELDVDRSQLRAAFAEQAKRFHPDRYFGKQLGPYAAKLARIFQQVNGAFEFLSDDERRVAYERVVQKTRSVTAHETRLREEKARSLLELATLEPFPVAGSPDTRSGPEREEQILKSRLAESQRRRRRLYTRLSKRHERAWAFYQQALECTRKSDTEGAFIGAQLATNFDPEPKEYAELVRSLRSQVMETRAADYGRRAEYEEQAGRAEAAAMLWARAAEARPRALYHRRAAESFLAANDVQRSVEHSISAIDLEPQSARAHLVLAQAFAMVHGADKAQKEADTALRLDPTLQEARKLILQLRRNK